MDHDVIIAQRIADKSVRAIGKAQGRAGKTSRLADTSSI
jgi:hypothetical protein